MKYQRSPVAQPQTSVAWHEPDFDSYPFFVVFAGLPFSMEAINPKPAARRILNHMKP